MAKRNMIEREKRRTQLIAKQAPKRAKLRAILKDPEASYEDKAAASVSMQKLPRDGSYTRQRRRCTLTGRPRGVYRKFALGRQKLREAAMKGELPGLKKASW